ESIWSFITSALTPEEWAKAFAPMAGLGSIASTLAAGMVSHLVDRLGLTGLLHAAGASYVCDTGGLCVRHREDLRVRAEQVRREYCVSVSGNRRGSRDNLESTTADGGKGAYAPVNTSESAAEAPPPRPPPSQSLPCLKKSNIFRQAYALFHRVPVLDALFFEVVISQCLYSLVNFVYLYKLKSTVADDAKRAGWSGSFYAWINGVSGIFQFFAIPLLLRHCEAHRIWPFMPATMAICVSFQFATYQTSGLLGASASFFAIKTMEYSLRGAANEMLYVSLGYESRYLGKKLISLIAGKFGKSATAVALSLVGGSAGHHVVPHGDGRGAFPPVAGGGDELAFVDRGREVEEVPSIGETVPRQSMPIYFDDCPEEGPTISVR
ncbi:LOW QUALITY PROTEIN: hypothetical protein ACHAWF_004494, partial [Thalassiosira exigua]